MISKGFGSLVSLNAKAISNCSGSAWKYFVDPLCWGYSRDAWNQMAQFQQGVETINQGTSYAPQGASQLPTIASLPTTPSPYSSQQQYQDELNAALKSQAESDQALRLQQSQGVGPVCSGNEYVTQDGVCVPIVGELAWWQVGLIGLGVVAAISFVRG